jgi:predicted HTH domain antitoxin
MKMKKVSVQEMSRLTGMSMKSIQGYIDGTYSITSFKWDIIKSAMDKYCNNIVPPPAPKVDNKSIIPAFVIESLTTRGNTIILKKKIKKREQQFLDELLKRGFNCRMYDTGDDHWVIEDTERYTKTI